MTALLRAGGSIPEFGGEPGIYGVAKMKRPQEFGI